MHTIRLAVILFVAVIFSEIVAAQGGWNVDFVGQVRTRGTSGYSQCWGYNGPDGKEYAILGCFSGTQIVDITSDTLKEVAFIPGPASGWREMKVYQHYAYVVTEGSGAGIQIIDLDSLKLVNTITTPQVPTGHTISIEGKTLYVNGSKHASGGIVALDLTDPVNPVFVGEYQTEYVHDCFIKNDTIYAAAIYGQGLDIIDATNKANMKRVSLTHYPYAGTHNTGLSDDGKYVFTTDEINSNPDQNGNLLRIWDRTDVTNLKLVGSYVARPHTIVHNIHIKGNYGYLAHYSEGVRILDLRYPEIPVEVGYYDTFVGSVNSYVGAWGTFPYFNSNTVIISDMQQGLFVIRFAGQNGSIAAARAVITVKDSVTQLPIGGVRVALPGRPDTLVTDNEGKVKFGLLVDTVTATFSQSNYAVGYITRQEKLVLQFDTLVSQTVFMNQAQNGSLKITVVNTSTNSPIRNFNVKIAQTPIVGKTDSTGSFIVPQLLEGKTFSVIAAQWGYTADTIDVQIIGGIENTAHFPLQVNGLDDFEIDRGWESGSVSDSGNWGRWQRGLPSLISIISKVVQPGSDHTENGGLCWVTGPTNNTTDNVEGRATFTSPTVDMLEMSNPVLLFWKFSGTRANPVDDSVAVELSNDNGLSWTIAEVYAGSAPQWTQHRIVLKDHLTVTGAMKVRFAARDAGIPTLFDAAIDDVEFGNDLQLGVQRRSQHQPMEFSLLQNYPNPFNPSTTIAFSLPQGSRVTLKIYDVIGREVSTLLNAELPSGEFHVEWNGTNTAGMTVESGVFFYRLAAGDVVQSRKMLFLK